MNKLIVLGILALSSVALAQPTGSAAPAAGSAAPAAGSAAPATDPPAPAPAPAANPDAHKACVDALNADPELAKRVVDTYSKKTVTELDQQVIDAHKAANAQIAENERHVIWAYAAMWILAALFLVYMWLRQQALKTELAHLRRDLDAAAKDSK